MTLGLIFGGYEYDYTLGKDVETWYDLDELNDAEHYYYHKALKTNVPNDLYFEEDVPRMILKGKLTAYEIEHNPNYTWLAD